MESASVISPLILSFILSDEIFSILTNILHIYVYIEITYFSCNFAVITLYSYFNDTELNIIDEDSQKSYVTDKIICAKHSNIL